MAKRIVITRTVDGVKRVIVGNRRQSDEADKSKTITVKEPIDRRPKPVTPKISITNEKNGYKYGGKVKFKTR